VTVNLSFRYAELDYVRALRAHYATRLRLRLDGAIAIAVGAYGIYLWRYTDEYWFALFCMGAAVFLILMLVAAFLIIPPGTEVS
jgi:hypothetical protein